MTGSPGRLWGCRLPRTTALAAVAVAALVVLELALASRVQRYDLVLVGSCVAGTALASWRLAAANSFETRLATGTLVGLTLLGQVLASSLGDPAGPGAHWGPAALAVVVAAVVALGLVAADAPPRTEPCTREHPYAL